MRVRDIYLFYTHRAIFDFSVEILCELYNIGSRDDLSAGGMGRTVMEESE